MRATAMAAAATCLLIARAPPADANVTYRWSDPAFTLPFNDSSITVSDAAYRSGSLIFDASCGDTLFPPCTPPDGGAKPPPEGWISGFQFPNVGSVAWIALTFEGNLLGGSLHVSLSSDQAFTYEGDGMNWNAAFIDGVETFNETGFYQRVDDPPPDDPAPEPASIAVLLTGLAGVVIVQQKRRRAGRL